MQGKGTALGRAPLRELFRRAKGRGRRNHKNEKEERRPMSTVRIETAARVETDIPMQPASYDIWDKKYRLKTKRGEPVDQTIDHTYQRVARAIADVEQTEALKEYWYERFLWALRRGAIP